MPTRRLHALLDNDPLYATQRSVLESAEAALVALVAWAVRR